MKLKGLTKLVLAGTALAATAATLTTSTYAWYVSNQTVTATGVQGSVAGSSVDGSLFIAQNKAFEAVGTQDEEGYVAAHEGPDKYITDITLGEDAVTGYSGSALDPQTKAAKYENNYYFLTKDTEIASGKKYYTKSEGVYTEVTTPAAADLKTYYEQSTSLVWVDKDNKKIDSPALLTFKFWLRSSQNGTAGVTFMVDNTTQTAITQSALAAGSGVTPTGVSQGDSFAVDAVNALRMDVTQKNGSADATTKTFAISEIAKNAAGTGAYATSTSKAKTTYNVDFVAGGDANKYYFSVLGKAPYGTNTQNGTSTDTSTRTDATWAGVELLANTDTLLTFSIWLEGTDADCWDSCRGQSFTFDFKFAFTPSAGA